MKPSAILLLETLPSNLSISHHTFGSSKGSSGGVGAGGLAPVEVFDAELELGFGCLLGVGCFLMEGVAQAACCTNHHQGFQSAFLL